MIRDKYYPATFVKYGKCWNDAVGYWHNISKGISQAVICGAAALGILVIFPMSLATILIACVLVVIGSIGAALARHQWYMYKHVEYNTSVLTSPNWDDMGTEEEFVKKKVFN